MAKQQFDRAQLNTLWVEVDGVQSMMMTATVDPASRFIGCVELRGPQGRGPNQKWDVKGGVASFRRLFVHPEFRGMGLGCMMVARLEAIAAEQRAEHIGCMVAVENKQALAFYVSQGYAVNSELCVRSGRGKVLELAVTKFLVPWHVVGKPVDGFENGNSVV